MKSQQEVSTLLRAMNAGSRFLKSQQVPETAPLMLVVEGMRGILAWVLEEPVDNPNVQELIDDIDRALAHYKDEKEKP